jgi:hypothetical protein
MSAQNGATTQIESHLPVSVFVDGVGGSGDQNVLSQAVRKRIVS